MQYGLTQSDDKRLRKIEARIKSVATKAVFDIGRQLIEARSILSTKAFSDWVQASVGIKPRQAHRYMAATKRFSAAHLGAQIPASVLMDLAPRSVPDEAVQQVVNLVNDGQQVSRQQARQIIQQFRELDARADDSGVIDAVSVEPSRPELRVEPASRAESAEQQGSEVRKDAEHIWKKYKNRRSEFAEFLGMLLKGAEAIDCMPVQSAKGKRAFDPTAIQPPGKLNCPEFKDMWAQWCEYNELMGKPLFEPVAVAQMNQLKGRPVDKACKCLEKAMADRLLAIPAMKELPKRFKPPTIEEVAAFIKERCVEHVDPVVFVNHYQKQGWKIKSGTPVTDWKAAVFQWQARAKKDRGKKSFEEMYGKDLTTRRRTVDPSEAYRADSTK